VAAVAYPQLAAALGGDEVPGPITFRRGDQHDLSVVYGDRLILKTFERLEAGVHPALELGRFLTDHTTYNRAAPVLGSIALRPAEGDPLVMGVLYGYVPNEGTAWQYTLDVLSRFYEGALAHPMTPPAPAPTDAWLPGVAAGPPAEAREFLNSYLVTAERLGGSTAEMHRALASGADPGLAPEPFGQLYQRSVYQGLRTRTGLAFRELARRLPDLPEDARDLARVVLTAEPELSHRFRAMLRPEVTGSRIRVHGNYHLGELLYTGSDFVVIDFEGDPDRPLTERRIKRSALRDVADMVRSFHYAALGPLYGAESGKGTLPGVVREADRGQLLGWARFWASWVSARFVQAYFAGMAGSGLLPESPAVCRELLEVFVIQKAVMELAAELDRRPDWAVIPLTGLSELLGTARAG
jgi:maltose alpha-D-glucosyltransferase/alpha-amylase